MVCGRTFLSRTSPLQKSEIRRTIVWEYVLIFAFWGSVIEIVALQNW